MPEHQRPHLARIGQYLKGGGERTSESEEDDDIDEGAQDNQKNSHFIANINVVQDLEPESNPFSDTSRRVSKMNSPKEKASKMYKDLYHSLMKS